MFRIISAINKTFIHGPGLRNVYHTRLDTRLGDSEEQWWVVRIEVILVLFLVRPAPTPDQHVGNV